MGRATRFHFSCAFHHEERVSRRCLFIKHVSTKTRAEILHLLMKLGVRCAPSHPEWERSVPSLLSPPCLELRWANSPALHGTAPHCRHPGAPRADSPSGPGVDGGGRARGAPRPPPGGAAARPMGRRGGRAVPARRRRYLRGGRRRRRVSDQRPPGRSVPAVPPLRPQPGTGPQPQRWPRDGCARGRAAPRWRLWRAARPCLRGGLWRAGKWIAIPATSSSGCNWSCAPWPSCSPEVRAAEPRGRLRGARRGRGRPGSGSALPSGRAAGPPSASPGARLGRRGGGRPEPPRSGGWGRVSRCAAVLGYFGRQAVIKAK